MPTSTLRPVVRIVVALLAATLAGEAEARLDLWDLKLGARAGELPQKEFKGYACGSNGGPPLQRLGGWTDFARCRADKSGLHEVYFEYDDEDEYIARALEDITLARTVGTVDKSFPIVASALFADDGVLAGLRMVTDPRPDKQVDNEWASLRGRGEHHLLGAFLAGPFKIRTQSDCVSLPLLEGETAVAGRVLKQNCERVDAARGVRYVIQQRFYRKPGQGGRDPGTGALTSGQFESVTRAEMYLVR